MSAEAIDRIHDTIQQCMNEGLLPPGMLTGWYLSGTGIDEDGDQTIILLNDDGATMTQCLAYIEAARLAVAEDFRTYWLDD